MMIRINFLMSIKIFNLSVILMRPAYLISLQISPKKNNRLDFFYNHTHKCFLATRH